MTHKKESLNPNLQRSSLKQMRIQAKTMEKWRVGFWSPLFIDPLKRSDRAASSIGFSRKERNMLGTKGEKGRSELLGSRPQVKDSEPFCWTFFFPRKSPILSIEDSFSSPFCSPSRWQVRLRTTSISGGTFTPTPRIPMVANGIA